MRKLTKNQENALSCLDNEWLRLDSICDNYALIQSKLGYNPCGSVWKSTVSRILKSLYMKNLIDHKEGGYYKLRTPC